MPDLSERAPAAVPPPALPWQAGLVQRFRHRQWLKIAGTCAFMAVFFAAYFHVMRHPVRPVLVLPLTALDQAVPFVPEALAIYFSLWFYVGIPAGLAGTLRAAAVYGLWAGALCLTGLAIFYAWPTAVPRLPIDVDRHPAFAVLHGVDAAGNACPSLHVASAVLAAAWIARILQAVGAPAWLSVINIAWCLAIAWSTMAVRQHVAVDVLGGFALGLAFALASRWGLRRR